MSEVTDRPEQGSVTDVPADEKAFRPTPTPPKRRSPAFVPAILTAVIAIGVIVALVARQPTPEVAQTPVEIAEQFMAALNDHDADAMLSLLAEDYTFSEGATEELLRGEVEQEGVIGWTYHVEACVENGEVDGPTNVFCDYAFSNDITRAVGAQPYEGSIYAFSIVDGEITSADNTEADVEFQDEALEQFFQWLSEAYPDAGSMYYQYDAQNGPENLAKWEQYLPEFVAAMEDAG
jgi:hypothetical protein